MVPIFDGFKDDFNAFLKNNAIWLCMGVIGIIVITLVIVFVIKGKSHKDKTPQIDSSNWLDALGGKDNVKEVNASGSRLSVSLLDKSLINRDQLTTLGVSNIVEMTNKVTLVIENKAVKIKTEIEKSL